MIQRAVKVRDGLKNWLSTDPVIGKIRLGALQLTSTEWRNLERVCDILQKFEEASTMMSGAKYPTLSLVMPLFVELFTFIEGQLESAGQYDELKEPLTVAHTSLAKYYSFTDDS